MKEGGRGEEEGGGKSLKFQKFSFRHEALQNNFVRLIWQIFWDTLYSVHCTDPWKQVAGNSGVGLTGWAARDAARYTLVRW